MYNNNPYNQQMHQNPYNNFNQQPTPQMQQQNQYALLQKQWENSPDGQQAMLKVQIFLDNEFKRYLSSFDNEIRNISTQPNNTQNNVNNGGVENAQNR